MVTSPVTSRKVENMCLYGGGLPCFTHYSCSGLTSSGCSLGKQGWGMTTLSPDAQDLPSLDSWASGDKARRRPQLELLPACPPATSFPPALVPVQLTGADH